MGCLLSGSIFFLILFALTKPVGTYFGIEHFLQYFSIFGLIGIGFIILTAILELIFSGIEKILPFKFIQSITKSFNVLLLFFGCAIMFVFLVASPVFTGIEAYHFFLNPPSSPGNNVENDGEDGYDSEDFKTGDFKEDDDIHHVDPHSVDGYERQDGTEVDGYYRGGEDGYERSDPDRGDSPDANDGGWNIGDFDFLGF